MSDKINLGNITTESCECVKCGCGYLAFNNSKEYKHRVCYRCSMKELTKKSSDERPGGKNDLQENNSFS